MRRCITTHRISLLLVIAFSLSFVCQANAQSNTNGNTASQTKKPITNSDIIRLVKNGFSDDQVMGVIAASEPKFDVSVDALIELKNAGVSQKLIDAILLGGKLPRASTGTNSNTVAPSSLSNGSSMPAQPYVQIVRDGDKSVLPPSMPTMLQTNAKGDNMATILADGAVREIATDAITSAAVSAIVAGPGIAAVPIVGAAGTVLQKLPGLRRDPTITLVYALANRQSANIIVSDRPKFELFFGDVVGANPDDFAPVLVKVSPTNNNWRLTGAQKTSPKYLQSHERTDFKFIEEIIPSRATNLGRGHIGLELQNPLQPGEYGIVLRPISSKWKVDMGNMVAKTGEGVLVMPVWDFSFRPETGAPPH